MNKAELIHEVQKRMGAETSRASAERAVEAVLGAVASGIKQDKQVQIVGFGAFAVTRRAARRGFNPHTKKPMTIKAMKTVRFKPGTELKAAL
ncbi:HU family DNA-binding protein [Horticoccus luteus]|uniref:HU family DNA-binding protein n=1 Tax=Horticoccus luteus TaxID=2862869 RepID=A0A8F9TXJ2_9BACT|nr:HU family DNA-binding protein [Horticoccus luteus]QYM79367.1 HU family DNA-binding protein [Horticoccus luteus]